MSKLYFAHFPNYGTLVYGVGPYGAIGLGIVTGPAPELPQFIGDERPDTNRSFLVFPNYIVTNKCGVFVYVNLYNKWGFFV